MKGDASLPLLRSADIDANGGTMMQLRIRYLLTHLERGQAGTQSQTTTTKKLSVDFWMYQGCFIKVAYKEFCVKLT